MSWWILLVSSAVAAAWATGVLRRYALRAGIIDLPNVRSSHSNPTPRGGGLAIVAVSLTSIAVACAMHLLTLRLFVALAGGGLAVAAVGFMDDRRPLPARIRLSVHFAAAAWALTWLKGFPPVAVGDHLVSLGWGGNVLGVLGIVWALNLFNFMDGIDGIAASEAIFVTGAAAGLALVSGGGTGVAAAAALVGAASGGFLWWNWPPARIFMGDAGSGYLGYAAGVLGTAAGHDNSVSLWVWLILGGVFFVDSTVTLARRTLRREPVYQAHRNHAYQWLARRWHSHLRVTMAVLLVNLLWLLPWAALATFHPQWILQSLAGALAPLIAVALASGSGRIESQQPVTR